MKTLIEKNFNKAAKSYDQMASIQKYVANDLVNLILEHKDTICPSKILDIGTGTGFMVEKLFPHFPGSSYIINDIAINMLHEAHRKLKNIPNLSIQIGDVEISKFEPVDLITSSLSFQWFKNMEITLKKLWGDTKVIAFSTLMDGSFKNWNDTCKAYNLGCGFHCYPSFKQLENLCLQLNPKFSYFNYKTYNLAFSNPKEFIYYLRELGANTSPFPHTLPYNLKQLMKLDKSINANYEVFYTLLIKE